MQRMPHAAASARSDASGQSAASALAGVTLYQPLRLYRECAGALGLKNKARPIGGKTRCPGQDHESVPYQIGVGPETAP